MATLIDWKQTPSPQMVARHAAQMLCSGKLVAFPTEAGCHVGASGLSAEAVHQLAECLEGEQEPLVVAVRGPGDAQDWIPSISDTGQRLARRFWPGPLILRFPEGASEGQLGRISADVRKYLAPQGALRLRSPAHPAIEDVLRICPEPVVLAPLAASRQSAESEPPPHPALSRAELVIVDGPASYPAGATVVEVEQESWKIIEPGVVDEDTLRRQMACMVVFLCTGNTCRSPLAEALMKRRLAERLGCSPCDLPKRGFFVLSAGLAAMIGGGAASEAIEVARSRGADLTGHQSRPLTADLAAQADYLIAMTRGHLQALQDHYPRLGARPQLLRPTGEDLPDPIGQSAAVYEECGQIIWEALDPLLNALHTEPEASV